MSCYVYVRIYVLSITYLIIVTLVCMCNRFSTYYLEIHKVYPAPAPVHRYYRTTSKVPSVYVTPTNLFLYQTFLFIGKATISMLLCDILSCMLLAVNMFHLYWANEMLQHWKHIFSLCIAIASAAILYHPVNSPVHLIHVARSRYGHTGCLYLI